MTTVNLTLLRDTADRLRHEYQSAEEPSDDLHRLAAEIKNLDAAADMLDPDADIPDGRLPENESPDLSLALYYEIKMQGPGEVLGALAETRQSTATRVLDDLIKTIDRLRERGYRNLS